VKQVLSDPLYYLKNFQFVLNWISERYGDLLCVDEHRFIGEFADLPPSSQALFVRMVMRKGEFFRVNKLSYAEIGDTRTALTPLIDLGWIELDPILELDQLFDLLQKSDIVEAFALTGAAKQLRKTEQRDHLRTICDEAKPYTVWHPRSDDAVVHVRHQSLCDRLRLIFFGNCRQTWSEFVLADLGIYVYESVPLSPESRGFQVRSDVDDYLALQRCRDQFENGEAIDQVLNDLAKMDIKNKWIGRRRDKLLYQLGEQAEKQKDWQQALAIYAMSSYPGARVRSIRVLEKMGHTTQALERLEEAQSAPESEAELQHIQRIAPRLYRKLGKYHSGGMVAKKVELIKLRLPHPYASHQTLPDTSFYVEGVVREHLMQEDAPVYYVENTLMNALFGLLCWPAIFKPTPGAFFHPFHHGPTDLTSADFYQRRREDFDACLARLETDEYLDVIRQTYSAKQGIQSPFVAWGALDEELLNLALTCIPATHLRLWCQRILADIRANKNGFPDLIQFWPQDKRYQMIEVKGPGDRLQDNQKRLIDFCSTHQLPIVVCYLEWLEVA
jgi:tetratricopeptide (TPR) repeat protein